MSFSQFIKLPKWLRFTIYSKITDSTDILNMRMACKTFKHNWHICYLLNPDSYMLQPIILLLIHDKILENPKFRHYLHTTKYALENTIVTAIVFKKWDKLKILLNLGGIIGDINEYYLERNIRVDLTNDMNIFYQTLKHTNHEYSHFAPIIVHPRNLHKIPLFHMDAFLKLLSNWNNCDYIVDIYATVLICTGDFERLLYLYKHNKAIVCDRILATLGMLKDSDNIEQINLLEITSDVLRLFGCEKSKIIFNVKITANQLFKFYIKMVL